MLKKRVVKVLLPLLFSFCFVFFGFLSVDASASVVVDYYNILQFNGLLGNFALYNDMYDSFGNFTSSGTRYFLQSDISLTQSSPNYFSISNPAQSNVNEILVDFKDTNVFNNINEFYDYYLVVNMYGDFYSSSNPYSPNRIFIRNYINNPSVYDIYTINDISTGIISNTNSTGFSLNCKLDLNTYSSIDSIVFDDISGGVVSPNLRVSCYIVPIAKNVSAEQVQSIITAINNQTNQLSLDIGQAADDIQQSIEDQYSGDPETEFSVDDVITQHNEKMGVLSFGSDVMLQFLDMFQSANVGTAQLTLPGFNITVENVEYSVWPDYSFNFEQLNEWVPALMSVIRVMLPVFVWLMVLRYCINVFEKNFLSNGG